MSAVDHSVGPQKEQEVRSAFKAFFNGPAEAVLSQNQ
jgi:hypothetical protein